MKKARSVYRYIDYKRLLFFTAKSFVCDKRCVYLECYYLFCIECYYLFCIECFTCVAYFKSEDTRNDIIM